jgi:hypothetical protein
VSWVGASLWVMSHLSRVLLGALLSGTSPSTGALSAYAGSRPALFLAVSARLVSKLDFPPLAGHRGYAARVDGSGWS